MYGRYLRDMWEWSDNKLEITHDYIQWMFPSTERSYANPGSPFVADEDAPEFSSDERVKENLRRSLERILEFFGFGFTQSSGLAVAKTATYETRKKKWFWKRNHNFFRITRILKSLNLCGLKAEAQAFFSCLDNLSDEEKSIVGSESFSFWREAAA